jgi:ribosomal protein L11 methyltransferase
MRPGRFRRRLQRELPHWLGAAAPRPSALRLQRLRRRDWSEHWKRFFRLQRVSSRLLICPSWRRYRPRAGEAVLALDPGMSFGTGRHGTTRACLEFLDALAADLGPVPFLDAGCGSGILALAAAKLGYAPVYAFDHDPQAVACARENLSRNGAAEAVVPVVADLAGFRPPQAVRVVAANLLAPLLLAHAETLVACLDAARGGFLLLSGILREQYAEVRARFQALGLAECGVRTLGEWTSGCFRLPAAGGGAQASGAVPGAAPRPTGSGAKSPCSEGN